MPCFPRALNHAFNSPGRTKLSKRRRWNRIFRSFRWKREKSNTSEGIPFFSKNFQWKSTFHLIYHRNNRFFRTKGKRPWFQELLINRTLDPWWKENLGVSRATFEFICRLVGPAIARRNSRMRGYLPEFQSCTTKMCCGFQNYTRLVELLLWLDKPRLNPTTCFGKRRG